MRLLALMVLALSACQPSVDVDIEFSTTPAALGAAQASLAIDQVGVPMLSWVEQTDDGATLKFSRWRDQRWQSPRIIAQGQDWFVNWADFPALSAAPEGRLVAHWLAKSADASYAYDVETRFSDDNGSSWQPAGSPHRDGTPTEHGFVSYFEHRGLAGMAWLDGRHTSGGHNHAGGLMTLRAATLDSQGRWEPSVELDNRVCDCCQTDAAVSAEGPVIVYRNRSADEVRDIAIVRMRNDKWGEPVIVHDDNWQIEACPVNGPAVAAAGRRVVVAWFTMAGGEAAVKIAFSHDNGNSFAAPIRVDQDQPLGRVDVALLPDDRAVVSWLERDAFDETRVHLALADPLQVTARTAVGSTSSARSSGFPRLVTVANAVWLVWRELDEDNGPQTARLRTARITFH